LADVIIVDPSQAYLVYGQLFLVGWLW
jgi:hypothetical protein